ncbi:unnamed protein product, partial [Ectocarpus sp. 4 AP-2014]
TRAKLVRWRGCYAPLVFVVWLYCVLPGAQAKLVCAVEGVCPCCCSLTLLRCLLQGRQHVVVSTCCGVDEIVGVRPCHKPRGLSRYVAQRKRRLCRFGSRFLPSTARQQQRVGGVKDAVYV